MTNLFKDFHKLCDSESQSQAQDFVLKAENAALKEQITNAKYSYLGAMADCKRYEETIAQQAEVIRLKDAALEKIACIGNGDTHGNSIGNCLAIDALALQPSPEILQDRDEQVAEACANLVNRFISGDGILNDTWIHEIEDEILSGEWRKYL